VTDVKFNADHLAVGAWGAWSAWGSLSLLALSLIKASPSLISMTSPPLLTPTLLARLAWVNIARIKAKGQPLTLKRALTGDERDGGGRDLLKWATLL
jgi:hypothetical protein